MLLWLLGSLLFIQVLLLVVLKPILNRIAPELFTIHFTGPGWIFPLFFFRAKKLSLMIRGGPDRDRVYLHADSVSFWVSPLDLLKGRIVLVHMRLIHPFLEYFNRQDSHEKNRLLPAPGRFLIRGGRILNGRIKVTDETRTPRYELELSKIHVRNGSVDVGVPAQLFFTLGQGTAHLGDGNLEVRSGERSGWLVLSGTLGDITSMRGMPFFGSRFLLEMAHKWEAETGRSVVAGQISGSEQDRNPVPFEFEVNWSDYRLTLDLGLQRLIEQVINSTRPRGISIKSGVLMGSRQFFELIKKDYGDGPLKEIV
ncbi:MAG: hypothetical protein K8S54_15960 [Spirochaetia bacterium]|nr:hypothetical protein [Spirochaetia bacterium]